VAQALSAAHARGLLEREVGLVEATRLRSTFGGVHRDVELDRCVERRLPGLEALYGAAAQGGSEGQTEGGGDR
jgi:hypothetical protein